MTSILIVDDSRLIRDLVAYALEMAGYSDITLAEDGLDGLEKAEKRPFDLILTDINMPRLNGLDFCKALRTKESYATVPIIVLTTESSAEMREKGKSAGASAWLVKPFVPNDLLYVVETLLGQ